ncbi:MAG: hypothetical protein HC830_08265 [Bacteroidetes bacterium]|nr:hypothetical protein [Bacteroidales bacterium]NJO69262.1 hypothetical protein [Bacteroidota bacterium]
MKLVALTLLIGTMNSFALSSYSQSAIVNIDLKNASIEQVLNEIEKTASSFFYLTKNWST